jgi:hypothetical protein
VVALSHMVTTPPTGWCPWRPIGFATAITSVFPGAGSGILLKLLNASTKSVNDAIKEMKTGFSEALKSLPLFRHRAEYGVALDRVEQVASEVEPKEPPRWSSPSSGMAPAESV